jgi:glycosyltransferase involved in cell wall biosynthesis
MKAELGLTGLVVMYVGNLESYQGIDLLLQSFALVLGQRDGVDLVIIGGDADGVEQYRMKSRDLDIGSNVHFLGPRPVELLASFLSEADILVSPRTKGNNTPMKVYPYLQSGKPVLATRLPTHTQVLTGKVAMLAEPNPQHFSEAMLRLIDDENARESIGMAGKMLAEEQFGFPTFRAKLNEFMDWLEDELVRQSGRQSKAIS